MGGVPGATSGNEAAQVLFVGGPSAIAAWNAQIALGESADGAGATFTIVDIADIADLEALVIAAEAAGFNEISFISEDNVADYCNVPGPGDIDLGDCIDAYRIENALAIGTTSYSSAEFDGWFN